MTEKLWDNAAQRKGRGEGILHGGRKESCMERLSYTKWCNVEGHRKEKEKLLDVV